MKYFLSLIVILIFSCQPKDDSLKDINAEFKDTIPISELEKYNCSEFIIKGTPSYNKLYRDTNIQVKVVEVPGLLKEISPSTEYDSLSFLIEKDNLIITHIYYEVGYCDNEYLVMLNHVSDSIKISVPEIIDKKTLEIYDEEVMLSICENVGIYKKVIKIPVSRIDSTSVIIYNNKVLNIFPKF